MIELTLASFGLLILLVTMKRCTGCDRIKLPEDFSACISKKDGLQPHCKECVSKRDRERYASGKIDREELQRRNRKRGELMYSLTVRYLQSHPCVDCGEDDVVVLDFDHVRGEKRDNVTTMARQGVGLDLLKAEIAKCDVRCANCHRRATAKRAGWRKDLTQDA